MGKENKCYLIDEHFCKFTQEKIAVAMGKVASKKELSERDMEAIDLLASIRSYFDWRDMREYSDKLKGSVDMDRFIHPEKPAGQRRILD